MVGRIRNRKAMDIKKVANYYALVVNLELIFNFSLLNGKYAAFYVEEGLNPQDSNGF
jgi:hypothetical protein